MVTNLNWIFTQLKDVMVPVWIGHLLSWRIKWYQCELDIYSAEGLNGTNLNWIFTQLKDVMVPMWIGHLLSWRIKWYQCELDIYSAEGLNGTNVNWTWKSLNGVSLQSLQEQESKCFTLHIWQKLPQWVNLLKDIPQALLIDLHQPSNIKRNNTIFNCLPQLSVHQLHFFAISINK